MKKSLVKASARFFVVIILIVWVTSSSAQVPSLRVVGAKPDPRPQSDWRLERKDVTDSTCLLITPPNSVSTTLVFVQARFVFVPVSGEPFITALDSNVFPKSVIHTLRNAANAGDKFIIDSIKIKINGTEVALTPFVVTIE